MDVAASGTRERPLLAGVALYTAFFVSGASALAFETLWFHQAGLAFGNSVWAASLTLSGFMAGLALGNGLAARLGDRLQRPVHAYALIECVLGRAESRWCMRCRASGRCSPASPGRSRRRRSR